MGYPDVACPLGKIGHPTRAAALDALRYVTRRHRRQPLKRDGNRGIARLAAYRCDRCGDWHLGVSRPPIRRTA